MLADPEQNWFICFPVLVRALYSESPPQGRRERSLFLSTVIILNRWSQHSHTVGLSSLRTWGLKLQDLHLRITNGGTPFPQGGVHRAGKGAALLELLLAAKKKQPAVPGSQTEGWRRYTTSRISLLSVHLSSCYKVKKLCPYQQCFP